QQLRDQEHQVALEVVQSHATLTSVWQRLDLAAQALDKATETMVVAQKRYASGLSSGVELLNAQDSLNSAREALAQARADYRTAQVNWRHASSGEYPVALPQDLGAPWSDLPEPEESP